MQAGEAVLPAVDGRFSHKRYSGGWLYYAGECLLIEGNYADAQAWFTKALAIPAASFDVKVEAGFQSAFCAFKMNNFKNAAHCLQNLFRSIQTIPRRTTQNSIRRKRSTGLAIIKRQRGSIRNPQRIRIGKEGRSAVWNCLAFYKQEKFPQAIESFEKLLVEYPRGKVALDARLRLGDAISTRRTIRKPPVFTALPSGCTRIVLPSIMRTIRWGSVTSRTATTRRRTRRSTD